MFHVVPCDLHRRTLLVSQGRMMVSANHNMLAVTLTKVTQHHSWSKWADKMYHILPRWQVDFTVFNCTGPPSQQPSKHFQHVTEEVFSPVQSSPSCCAHKQTHTRGFNTFCTLAVGESLYKYHQILLADFWGHMSNHMRISQDLRDLIEVPRRKWQSGRLKATERLLNI